MIERRSRMPAGRIDPHGDEEPSPREILDRAMAAGLTGTSPAGEQRVAGPAAQAPFRWPPVEQPGAGGGGAEVRGPREPLRTQTPSPWPELPPAEDEPPPDAVTLFTALERQRRLDREQQGLAWSE